jgi:hypothetical protein
LDGELFGAGVDEAVAGFVPADVLHEELLGGQAGLLGGVAEIGDGEEVFGVVGAGEVDGLFEIAVDVFPLGD